MLFVLVFVPKLRIFKDTRPFFHPISPKPNQTTLKSKTQLPKGLGSDSAILNWDGHHPKNSREITKETVNEQLDSTKKPKEIYLGPLNLVARVRKSTAGRCTEVPPQDSTFVPFNVPVLKGPRATTIGFFHPIPQIFLNPSLA